MSTTKASAVGAAILIAAIAIVALSTRGNSEAQASQTDGAFIAEMTPHHQMAIEMAKIAEMRAQHPQIRRLAGGIIAGQSSEIRELDRIHERLFGQPVSAGPNETLGLPAAAMGMNMDMNALASAQPFDREFIDMMIPHHQGAIRMARIEQSKGEDPRTRALADNIVSAQSKEIAEMNSWRQRWYGAPSPAGGVPARSDAAAGQGESGDGMDGMQMSH